MSFLTRKYPLPQGSHWLRDCIIYCVIVFLILYLLQPFGFSMYKGNKFLVSLLFGAVTFVCCYVFGMAFYPFQKSISPWRIWHQILSVIALILFISIGNFFVFSWLFHIPITLTLFLMFLYQTLIIGAVVTICSVSLNYYRYLRNQLESLLEKTTEEQIDIVVTIHDTKNNVSVCYVKDEKVTYTEIHTTLAAVLEELNEYKNIFQCHRSFVVNLNNITSAQGNSNGYQLRLGHCPTIVPVSRTYVPKLRSFIA